MWGWAKQKAEAAASEAARLKEQARALAQQASEFGAGTGRPMPVELSAEEMHARQKQEEAEEKARINEEIRAAMEGAGLDSDEIARLQQDQAAAQREACSRLVQEAYQGFKRLYLFTWLDEGVPGEEGSEAPDVRIGDLWIE